MPLKRRKRKNRKNNFKLAKRMSYNHCKLKLRQIVELATNADGDFEAFINTYSLTNFYEVNTLGTVDALEETANVKALYDQYRPIGVHLKFIPRYTNFQAVNTINEAGGEAYQGLLNAMPQMAICYDVDNVGQLGSYAQAITRDNCVIRPFNKPWSLYFKIPRVTQQAASLSSPTVNQTGGWANLQNEGVHVSGGVKMLGDSTFKWANAMDLANSSVGSFLLTYYCEFKSRQ